MGNYTVTKDVALLSFKERIDAHPWIVVTSHLLY